MQQTGTKKIYLVGRGPSHNHRADFACESREIAETAAEKINSFRGFDAGSDDLRTVKELVVIESADSLRIQTTYFVSVTQGEGEKPYGWTERKWTLEEDRGQHEKAYHKSAFTYQSEGQSEQIRPAYAVGQSARSPEAALELAQAKLAEINDANTPKETP